MRAERMRIAVGHKCHAHFERSRNLALECFLEAPEQTATSRLKRLTGIAALFYF